MEEFKSVKWEIIQDDLKVLSKDQLIQQVLDKHYEIDCLKYEVWKEVNGIDFKLVAQTLNEEKWKW